MNKPENIDQFGKAIELMKQANFIFRMPLETFTTEDRPLTDLEIADLRKKCSIMMHDNEALNIFQDLKKDGFETATDIAAVNADIERQIRDLDLRDAEI